MVRGFVRITGRQLDQPIYEYIEDRPVIIVAAGNCFLCHRAAIFPIRCPLRRSLKSTIAAIMCEAIARG